MAKNICLKLGIMANKELAEWFSISASTFSHDKDKKIQELNTYADFQLVGNKTKKVKINKIYQPVYHKKGSENFEKIKAQLPVVWSDTGLDSCTRVCYKIMKTTELNVKESTAYNYTLKSRNDLYGKPFQQGGTLGKCKYVWCKQETDGELRFLTEEEQEIKRKLITKYFGDASEKQVIVQGMVEAGEISKEQAWTVLTEMTNMQGANFLTFLRELQEKIGCKVIRGTLVEKKELCAWEQN